MPNPKEPTPSKDGTIPEKPDKPSPPSSDKERRAGSEKGLDKKVVGKAFKVEING